MGENELKKKEIYREFHEMIDGIPPEDLHRWLAMERKGRDPHGHDPGDHAPNEEIAHLATKPISEIGEAEIHQMSTLVNYLREHGRRKNFDAPVAAEHQTDERERP